MHSFFAFSSFTAHRNGDGAENFMMEKLGFADKTEAKALRQEYFKRYHSTAKALTVAEQEGKLPPLPPGQESKNPRFDPNDLAEYWASNLRFELLGEPKTGLLEDLRACPLKLVAFSNGPRKYVKRVLETLGLWEIFGEDRLFAVDDVLPHCKPEKEAFQVVFDALGVRAESCVMIEDSMKNIRRSKELGLKTVLVAGKERTQNRKSGALSTTNNNTNGSANASSSSGADASELTKTGDLPLEDDPAVDVCIGVVEDLRKTLPGLWKSTATFNSTKLPN